LPKDQKGLSIITGDELIGYMAQQLLLSNKKYTFEDTGTKDPDTKEKIFQTKEENLTNYDPISKWEPISGATG